MARIARWLPALAVFAVLFVPDPGSAQVYQPSELTDMPRVRSTSQAQKAIQRTYPRALREAGISGKVQIRFVVDESGKVDPSSIEVVAATAKVLGEAAAKAVANIQFVPGKKDGAAVSAVVVIPITYGAP